MLKQAYTIDDLLLDIFDHEEMLVLNPKYYDKHKSDFFIAVYFQNCVLKLPLISLKNYHTFLERVKKAAESYGIINLRPQLV